MCVVSRGNFFFKKKNSWKNQIGVADAGNHFGETNSHRKNTKTRIDRDTEPEI